jgi:serine/threonine protein kinase
MVGTTFAGYQILRKLGQGGMGVVYEGIQTAIGRRVAIKVLHPEYAEDAELLTRFFNEARAANLIPHPAIVQVSDFGRMPNGAAYLVMEFLDGRTLTQYFDYADGRLSVDRALPIVIQIADALAAAHSYGVVHRDLKPSNIMLLAESMMPEGIRVKILDFGIAKLEAAALTSPLTRSGVALGTPMYMAPEQCIDAGQVDGKADVYALGIILFEMLTGQPPFVDPSDLSVLNMQVSQKAPSLRSLVPTLPPELSEFVQRMLEKQPMLRPAMSDVQAVFLRMLSMRSARQFVTPSALVPIDPLGETEPRTKQPLPAPGRVSFGATDAALTANRHRQRILLSVTVGSLAGLALLAVTSHSNVKPENRVMKTVPNSAGPSADAAPHAQSKTQVTPQSTALAAEVPLLTQLEIDSTPRGAEIIDAERDAAIGRTPWNGQFPFSQGDVWLILRKDGHHDRVLRIKLKPGVIVQRLEALMPTRQLRKSLRTPKEKRLRLDELKSRWLSNPDMGTEVDIPEIAD